MRNTIANPTPLKLTPDFGRLKQNQPREWEGSGKAIATSDVLEAGIAAVVASVKVTAEVLTSRANLRGIKAARRERRKLRAGKGYIAGE